MQDIELLLRAKARQLGVSTDDVKAALAWKIVSDDTVSEENPAELILSITKHDVE
ncbi:hypothetical protein LRP52_28870 [Photobacterium sp. ZSDE20]|uniref:Uncharacterized protein n=1 Tax=Photobacterium pectinilyticum TaxID=2906793 RepID=A0ABT1N8L1_9GAMM|nr:hypothetical protein [Photobacterium sp. ZSDE20]MCQ1061087.1 hypothetical protein [Photobacterium sp. ZSDE20]MDD1826194.1 hypothetical protein [Photobacterium sp. ZSDE20]